MNSPTTTQPPPQRQMPPARPAPRRQVTFGAIQPQGHRIVLYGPGGIGKTSAACMAPGPVAFIDLDESMPVLRAQLPADRDIRIVSGVAAWGDLRDALHSSGWDGIRTIVIDSVTKAEELAGQFVLENIPLDSGKKAQRLEEYGWGKQFGHIYDTFLALLGDLDQHVRAGRHVILIAHDCTCEVPNPAGANWLRYEPRLQSPSSGKNSVRLRVREWADHVLFCGYDVDVKAGKGTGTSTRTVYPVELPHCMAKSRVADTAIPLIKGDSSIWTHIIKA